MPIGSIGGSRLPPLRIGGDQPLDWGQTFRVQPASGDAARSGPTSNAGSASSFATAAQSDRLLSRLRALVAQAPTLGAAQSPSSEAATATSSYRAGSTFSIAHTTTQTAVSGANREQVTGTDFGRLSRGERIAIEGQVTRTAAAATLTIRGGAGGVATAGGTYQLTGNRGSADIAVSRDESLAALGARINEQVAVTGVEADLVGDDLVLSSIDLGSAAFVDLQPLAAEQQTTVAGVSSAQLAQFAVSSFTAGASETLAGSLESAAQRAELVYHGASGNIAGTASFRLQGERGAVDVTVTGGETLTAAAARINEATAATGVIATVDGDDIRLTSDTIGAAARVEISAVERAHDTVVSGVNDSQIDAVEVSSIETGSQHVLAGTVTRTASAAELALQGSAGGTVLDTATFELRGSTGTATLDIAAGETLASVAARVNELTDSTGVSAAVVSDQLRFTSSDVGSSARVEVELLHVAHETSVSGVNSQQLASFQVNQFNEGASQTLNGSITQTATQAELTFTGNFISRVGSNATIRLNGSQGSVQLSVTSFQTLSSLATQVNQHTQTTGVTATVQGNKLFFRSTSVGSAAAVDIDVLSGSFNVTGGTGQGTATGMNAVAVINGQTISGAGNDFQYADALGTYAFSTVSGFTGALSPVNVVSQAGSFEISGGNGDGTATGLDGLATINGTELTGLRNRYVVNEPGGQFELEFAAGFAGPFDSVTVSSVPEPFDIAGGDGAGRAAGSDARAIFNGSEYTSADGQFVVQGAQGSYAIEFAAGFTGAFDAITIQSTPRLLAIQGGDGAGRDSGEDAEAIINGVARTGAGNTFRFVAGGRAVNLVFVAEFTGQFDPIEAFGVESTVFEIVHEPASTVRTTKDLSVAPHTSDLEAAVGELNLLLDEAAGNASIGLDSEGNDLLLPAESGHAGTERGTRAAIVREQFTVYSRLLPQLAANAWISQGGGPQPVQNLVDLIA